MSNMRIIEIPASMRESAGRKNTVRKLRVAAYCRVSTEEEEQQGSFEIQKLYYTEKINSTPEWEVAGIYADDGISGVHTKKRDGFNQMIQDCKKRKIDLILTKSISRFARNTLDSIQYVRMLKQIGIAVVFEKENINTATMNSEMILTVLSAFAQAESESISQNVARGKRMGFKQGKFPFPYGQMLGYRKGADGKPEIISAQAEVIRLIYNSYLQGDSLQNIKKRLETAGAVTARGNTTWSSQAILRILQNEKYCGDVLLQKTFTEDVLTGVHKKNTGQLPQYYIENHHEGIVTKQVFREVQEEIAKRQSKNPANIRKKRKGRYNSRYALSGRLVCGECGSSYKRVTWDIHGRKEVVWRCANRAAYGTKFCKHSPSIPEEELHEAILKAIQELTDNFTAEVSAQLNGILQQIERGENSDTSLQTQLEQAQQEFDRLLELSLDLDEQTPFLDNKLKSTNEKIKALKRAISESAEKKKQTPSQLRISEKDLQIKEYDDTMTARIVESIKVKSRNEIEIQFVGGYKEKKMLN
ncbi:recombinase family protein [uncultured Gemmiger sp.]|uniref:recombinase family protein n=1 Tax=uncultured Gemmiger sp. TaxID=1623490 RepID=UPI002593FAD6|nr:recombinase family protein [uncultured Gemmiger sp.]